MRTTEHYWPTPQAIKSAIENELIEEMKDHPLVTVLAARRAVAQGIRNAIAEHKECVA